MGKYGKNRKGITMISLIITIVIMLILAGVAIKFTIDNNGLFTKVQLATKTYNKSKVEEELQLAVANAYMENVDVANVVKVADLNNTAVSDDIETRNLKIADAMSKEIPNINWIYKSSLAGNYKGYDFTVINQDVKMDVLSDISNTILNGAKNNKYFWNGSYIGKIKNITFKIDDLANYTTNIVSNDNNENAPWDVSRKQDNSIIAYLETNSDDNTLYNLYIVSNKIIKLPEDSSGFFNNFGVLVNLNGLENIDTYNVLNMNRMFSWSTNIVNLNLTSFNTSNVTDMSYMFDDMLNLALLNLGDNFDTSNATNMKNMFTNCNNLETLNLGVKFDTSKVTNMNSMFLGCNKITSLNLENNFNTSNVINMNGMFENCQKLKTLDLGENFDTSKVTNMSCMFKSCFEITSLNLRNNFNTSNVTDMSNMFEDCNKLQALDLGSNFNTSKVTDISCMFRSCNALESLTLGNNFDTSKVTNMSWMFGNCWYLKNIDLGSNFVITSDDVIVDNMFYDTAKNTTDAKISCREDTKNTIESKNLTSIKVEQKY